MREPAVAGTFYPGDKKALGEIVSKFLSDAGESAVPVEAVGGICPHAGYVYSGDSAAMTFASISNLKKAETVVILGPNHSGRGSLVSLSLQDWETPLGIVKCDSELAKKIQKNFPSIDFDERAHLEEHSLEVQLPFIQKIYPKAKIIAICLMDQDYESAKGVAKALSLALDVKKHIVIASSDLSHYLPADVAEKKDKAALGYMEALDGEGFQFAREKYQWSVCGYGPITVLLEYAKSKKVKQGKLLKYTNSGMRTGDFGAVVGYASMVFPVSKKGVIK